MEKSIVNNKITNLPVPVKGLIFYVLMLVVYMINACTGFYLQEDIIQSIMACFIVLLVCISCYYRYYKKITGDNMLEICIELMIIAGIVMRIGCMLYSDCRIVAYDLGEFQIDQTTGDYHFAYYITGHAGYIMSLLQGLLPQSNDYQFYQQPLFYLLGAATSFISTLVVNNYRSDIFFVIDPAKIISTLASILTIYVVNALIKKLKFSKAAHLIAITFFSLFPGLIMLSVKVTPDALVAFFISLTLLYICEWQQNPNWKNTVILALSFGLAVMTKISGALLAPLAVIVFIVCVAKKNITISDAVKKCLAFLFISLPIGLWYNIRNLIKFNQPLGYVYPQEIEGNNLYMGMHSLLERFVPDFKDLVDPSARQFEDYNFFSYFLKTSLYSTLGMCTVKENLIGLVMIGLALVSTLLIIIAIFKIVLTKNYSSKANMVVIALIEIVSIFVAAYFYYGQPFSCAMEFRYMAFIVLPSALLIGWLYDNVKNRYCKDGIELSILFSSFLSVLFYLLTEFMY